MKQTLLRFLKTRRALAALALLVGVAVGGVWLAWPAAHSDAGLLPAGAAGREMALDAAPWQEHQRDGAALLADLKAGRVEAVGITPDALLVSTAAGERYFVLDGRGAFANLAIAQARDAASSPFELAMLPQVHVGPDARGGWDRAFEVIRVLLSLLLPVALIGVVLHVMRQDVFSMGKLVQRPRDIRFADVIGASEAKAALSDVVQFLQQPARFAALGAHAPRGVLMLGGPGVGKTLLAKALAGEAGVNFIATNGSEFTSKFFGVGVAKVKQLFATARKNAPCILFIDEIDGLAKRSQGNGAAESEGNRIINQVLVEMDGFAENAGVIVIGATNLAENLDEALLREGRFDRRVHVKLPDVRDRADILRLYAKKLPAAPALDFERLARVTTGLAPSALAYIVNHAALVAAREDAAEVSMAHLMESVETARIGERNGAQRALSPDELHRVAVHEAGHAVVASALHSGKVEKVTILPRGGALGVTLVTQEEDKTLYPKSFIEARIQMLLAGRGAELLLLGEASSGAAQDLQECSRLALDMVARYGLSEQAGLFSLAAVPAQHAGGLMSDAVKQANALLNDLEARCAEVLQTHLHALKSLTAELLEQETVEGDRVEELVHPALRRAA
ncbi:ATP-dependent metallopeptidase FtsH/Yme1/Tma family protein [Xylophilus sp. GOD-11R]|uniref:ATP-dependent metallopeptidase FtsH/Yme1/Tma family protein n=1 Tax=Xylophilus sp. GOD-11R TaxID=3089814 RepID=UPI00298CB8E2|nr:AAA family ATPase [Xylophilus sp. GOD-11R]WPB57303.1 AAA family ATPase [Xylophilus sp. GOD-11R]